MRELAEHLDRVRRETARFRAGINLREFAAPHLAAGAWMSVQESPALPAGGAVPSQSQDRIFFLSPKGVITPEAIEAAIGEAKAAGRQRVFIWMAPWGVEEATRGALAAVGAVRWPYVEYIALARRAEVVAQLRPTNLVIRRVAVSEVASVFAEVAPWYTAEGAATGTRLVEGGACEMHAAFEGERPVAVGLLALDGDWAYLFAAGTDPAFRSRGGQSALIAARVTRAAEAGASMCSCETNTMVPISLANLHRYGFEDRIAWHVYVWNEPAG